jgi:hypothetical protein
MDPFAPHLSAGHFRPEAYVAPDRAPRSANAGPIPGSAREVDRDRRPTQPVTGETAGELEFADLLDVINPLQHIPVIGDLYRSLTGDQIDAPARVAGGAIFGGPLGFVSGIVNAIAADVAGQNIGESVIAAVFGDGEAEPALAQTAAPATVTAAVQAVPADPAPLGASQPQAPLTGAAALQALVEDLRLAETRPPPMSSAFAPTLNDAPPLAPSSPASFSDRMLEGLNKYKALVTEQNAPPVKPATSAETLL